MKTKILLFISFCIIGSLAAQTPATGDYRSTAATNMGIATGWQRYNGSAWVAASNFPAGNVKQTASITNGSPTITLSAANSAIRVGQFITGTGIVAGTTVTNIDVNLTTLTISNNATATNASAALTFVESSATASTTATTGNTTSGSNALTLGTGNGNVVVGMFVSGTGIPAGTTITTVTDNKNFVMSQNATATGSSLSLSFAIASVTAGSNALYLSIGNSSIVAGMLVTGTGIPAGTTITTVTNNQNFVMSQNATGTQIITPSFTTASTIAGFTSGSSTITLNAANSLLVFGMSVYGSGITQGTTITSITGTTIGISLPTTAAATATGITFGYVVIPNLYINHAVTAPGNNRSSTIGNIFINNASSTNAGAGATYTNATFSIGDGAANGNTSDFVFSTINIASGATFSNTISANSINAKANSLILIGGVDGTCITNDGTLDLTPATGNVSLTRTTFLTQGNTTFAGTGVFKFNDVTLQLGSISYTLNVPVVMSMGNGNVVTLKFNSGIFKISSASTLTIPGTVTNLSIPVTSGLYLNHASANVTCGWTDGTGLTVTGFVTLENGKLTVNGRYNANTSGTTTISGGTLEIPAGLTYTNNSGALFQVGSTHTFNMTGGNVNIKSRNLGSYTNPDLYVTSTSYSMTGGTFTFSDATPININCSQFYNLNISTGVNINGNATISNLTIGSGSILNVNAGKQLTVSTTLSNSGALNLLSTSANGSATILTPATFAGTGTYSAQQYLGTTRNWYVSSPITNAKAPNSGYTYFMKRDETGQNPSPVAPATAYWVNVAGNSNFSPGTGYIALPSAMGTTLQFNSESTTGKFNTGTVPVTLTWAGAASKGFNLIGNPYPSHLTWTKAFVDDVTNAALIEPSIYYRTNTGDVNSGGNAAWSFKTYNSSTDEFSPAGTTNIIPPMQAFWIRAKAAGTLNLDSKLTRSHQSSNPMKAPAMKNNDRQRVRLEVSNGTRTDETLLLFDENAADGYDAFDSPKFAEASSEVQIFTTVEDEKLVMNGMKNLPLNQEISLGFIPGNANSFIIKANEITNLPTDVKVILIDKATLTETDLTDGNTVYSFVPVTTVGDRFSVIFRTSSSVNAVDNLDDKVNMNVFVDANKQINVSGCIGTNCKIVVCNAIGQKLIDMNSTGTTTTINKVLKAGVYFVTLNVAERISTKKLIIN